MKVVAISGYFDPGHKGHMEYIKKAGKLGDYLVVILNNEVQSRLKYGNPFIPIEDRIAVLESIKGVNSVFVSIDKDRTVCKSLKRIKPNIFAKGGDRKMDEIPEKQICEELNIQIVDGLGEKLQSSSKIRK